MRTLSARNQKRVAIAQDVLDQLAAGQYRARTGVYLSRGKTVLLTAVSEGRRAMPACDVCALGSLFVSSIRCFDGFKETPEMFGVVNDRPEILPQLAPYFDELELREMEGIFEGWSHVTAVELWRDAPNRDRLAAIMYNIVVNDGEFRPDEL